MTTELEQKFFETFDIQKIFKTTINIGDLDTNYEEIQAPTLKELYEEARFDFETPIYFSWFKRSKRWSEEYPQITDKQYLELICISNKELIKRFDVSGSDLESIKSNILSKCIKDYTFYSNTLCETYNRLAENFKHQVQAIFEGERCQNL